MAQPNSALTPLDDAEALTDGMTEVRIDDRWRDVVELLGRAAQLAAARGTETERFMQAAWTACLDASPGLREEIADKELRSQLKKLRKRGLVASA